MKTAVFMCLGVSTVCLTLSSKAVDAQACIELGGRVVSLEGDMTIAGLPVLMGDEFCVGDQIVVGPQSRAAIRLATTQTVVRVKQNSTFSVEESEEGGPLLKMLKGVLYLFSRRPRYLSVDTPYLNAAIDGTEFVIETSNEKSEVTVIEGDVRVSNAIGNVRLRSGESASAQINKMPLRRTVVEPLNAVQWALYYPPIGANVRTSEIVRSAARSLARGDVDGAAVSLALASEDAGSLALRSIIAVTRNQSDEAISLAQRAITDDPESSLAYSALSYAQQASFDLNAAWRSASRSVEIDDENVFALSRLAEVEITRGHFKRALSYAKRAEAIEPDYPRNYSLIGFVNLNMRNYAAARIAFEKAVELDNSDPMPHLGLGLVAFKNNQVVKARELIEVAVSLDPANSLYRSYLGKAYYEEAEPEFADQQFELAKIFDSNDPTPWYYDAISQSPNSTGIQELDNLNEAIRLNGNRAIYRSKFALDSDLATRGVNLANLYQRLGANRQATIEATRSLGIDPSNYSAHRFLAGAYEQRPRHEIARVSELLQSQLLNPLNTDPILASSSYVYTDSALESGTSIEPGLYEYTSVFERNGPRLKATVEAGTQDQFKGDLAGSWLWNNAILSAGLTNQHSDGYRPNNDVTSESQNVFSQWTPNNNVSVQAEYRHRSVRQGDLKQQFDLDDFTLDLRRNTSSDIFRIGSRLELTRRSSLLLSGVSSRIETEFSDSVELQQITERDDTFEDDAKQIEMQHLLVGNTYSMIAGFGKIRSEKESVKNRVVGGIVQAEENEIEKRNEENVYIYLYKRVSEGLNMTLGGAYSEQKYDDNSKRLAQPKLGLEWRITDDIAMRIAYFKAIKRLIVANQSLEPTQIAGFNQYYDDTNGTKAERIGAALDFRLNSRVTLGLEASERRSDFVLTADIARETREQTLNAGLFWAISKRLAFAADISLDHYENLNPSLIIFNVRKLRTVRLPMSFTYMFNNQFHIGVSGLVLYQSLSRADESDLSPRKSETIIGNMFFGYKSLNRKASVSLGLHNITDTRFRYQDEQFRSAQVLHSTELYPERRIVLQATYHYN